MTMYCALEICLRWSVLFFIYFSVRKQQRKHIFSIMLGKQTNKDPEASSLFSSDFSINFMLLSYIQAQYKQNTVSTKYSGFSIASLQSIIGE